MGGSTGAVMELYQAVSRGDVAELRRLVASGMNVDVLDEDGWTALLYAALNGHVEAIRVLVELGANKDAKVSE